MRFVRTSRRPPRRREAASRGAPAPRSKRRGGRARWIRHKGNDRRRLSQEPRAPPPIGRRPPSAIKKRPARGGTGRFALIAVRLGTRSRLLLDLVLGVDDVVVLLAVCAGARMGAGGAAVGLGLGGRAGAAAAGGRAALVHFLGQLMADLREVVHGLADAVAVLALGRLAEVADGALDRRPRVAGHLLADVAEHLLGLVGQVFGLVLQ